MVAIETIISPRSMPPAGIVQRIAKERESKSPPNEGAVSSRASHIDAAANYRGKLAQAKAVRRAKNSITPPPASSNNRQPPTTSNAAGNTSTPIYRLRNNPSPSPPTLHHKNGNHQSLPRSTPPLTPQTIHHQNGNHQRSHSGGINPYWMKDDAQEMAQVDLFGNKIRSDTSHPTNVRIYPNQDAANSIDVSTIAASSGSVGGNNIEVAYHVGLPNLLSNDDDTVKSSATHDEFTDTEFYKRFDEAFNMTLRNNPGILPGASTVVDSIRQSMLKVKKAAAQTEKEMRMRLEKVNSEKNQLEAQLRAEMGKDAMRRNELTKELADRTQEKDVLQESLTKQIEAVEAVKRELTAKANGATKEKEELQTHLRLLSKSRVELEAALETEMKAVQRDRDDLSKILAERKKLQQQKEENKDLEKKIEHMTEAAQKEKLALQAEVAELKSFEEHIAKVRKENEEARKALEQEKRQLKELAETMQLKKMSAMESLKDLEAQFQEEIDEINGKIERAKMMHEKDVESIIKSRVMTYLREGRRDEETTNEPVNQVFSQDEVVQVASQDIEGLICERVEAELKKKMETDRSDRAEFDQKMEAERIKADLKRQIELEMEHYEAELKRKMEFEAQLVKDELSRKLEAESAAAELKKKQMETELIEAELRKKRLELERFEDEQHEKKENEARKANLRTICVQTSTMAETKEDTMREEIDRLREDLQMIQSRNPRHSLSSPIQPRRDDVVLQEIQDLRNEIALASPGIKSPRVTFQRGSPRYGSSRLYREEAEKDDDVRLNRNSLPYTSPRAQRSPMYRGEEKNEMRTQRRSLGNMPPLRQRNPSSRSGYYF